MPCAALLSLAEITKPFSGRLRPDFLARCQPAELGGAEPINGPTFSPTFSSSAPSLAGFRLGQTAGPCTNDDHAAVRDGRLR